MTGKDRARNTACCACFRRRQGAGRARDDGEETRASEPAEKHQGWNREQERAIRLSNVALVCPTCGPVRVGHEVRGDRKVRVCKKCKTTLDK